MYLHKQLNTNGQKAYQRGSDTEDRSLPYRNWLRTVETNGFFLDIDFIKWRTVNGELQPIAITDLTRTDSENVSENYLLAIESRIFTRDKQGAVLKRLGELLNIPVYLILFPKSVSWLYVYSFKLGKWKKFTPEEWAEYLKSI